uniref:VP4 protein n=1 Tax=Kadipiro virus TaxID=104580 RepID=A0A8E0KI85_9REOV|nr:TPA: VP4 protein [Kadipiro virus]
MNYSRPNAISALSASGFRGYFPDSSVSSALIPRLVVTNDREHVLAGRLKRIEDNIAKNKLTEHDDIEVVKSDYESISNNFKEQIKFDNATDRALHDFSTQIKIVDNEREKEMTVLLGAVNDNSQAINDIIKDVTVIDNVEKANLILEKVISISRATAKTAEIAADGVGVVPVFGPSIANGAKIAAHTAEMVANTAEAVKASGILNDLNETFKAVTSVHARPNDLIKSAVKSTNNAIDLAAKLKVMIDSAKRKNDAGLSKISIPSIVIKSTVEWPRVIDAYDTHCVYKLHPPNGAVGLIVEVKNTVVTYQVKKQYGDLDFDGFGEVIIAGGKVVGIQGAKRIVDFHLSVDAAHSLAMVMAVQGLGGKIDSTSVVGYFEEYFELGMRVEKPEVDNAFSNHLHDLVVGTSYIDWHKYETEMLNTHTQRKDILINEVNESLGAGSSIHMVPNGFITLETTPTIIELSPVMKIGAYSVFEHLFGPFVNNGTYTYNLVIDVMGTPSKWYTQLADVRGQVVSSSILDAIPTQPVDLVISGKGSMNTIANSTGLLVDRRLLRIYVKQPKCVRIFCGWKNNVPSTRFIPKTVDEQKTFAHDFSKLHRYLDPNATLAITEGANAWGNYNSGKYNNPA